MEAALLGCFMLSACIFGVLLEYPDSPLHLALASAFLRRSIAGVAMGITAIAIVYSPWGKQSGAHINPAITLSFLRLRKIGLWDALFYMSAQFLGSAVAVALVSAAIGRYLSHPAVNYVITIPGKFGSLTAFAAEFVISFLLMTAVLSLSGTGRLAKYTGLFVGVMVATYITFESPLSGMSMNPARTLGSAISADVWSAIWIYFVAPPVAMLAAVELHLLRKARVVDGCAKLHHENTRRCIFCGANGGFAS